nr:succinate dehydrogenase assembly factor 4 [Solimonas sp. SE-A11]
MYTSSSSGIRAFTGISRCDAQEKFVTLSGLCSPEISVSHSPDPKIAGASKPDEVVSLAELLEKTQPAAEAEPEPAPEVGGRSDGPDPTRYGDWEKNGRCIDF